MNRLFLVKLRFFWHDPSLWVFQILPEVSRVLATLRCLSALDGSSRPILV